VLIKHRSLPVVVEVLLGVVVGAAAVAYLTLRTIEQPTVRECTAKQTLLKHTGQLQRGNMWRQLMYKI